MSFDVIQCFCNDHALYQMHLYEPGKMLPQQKWFSSTQIGWGKQKSARVWQSLLPAFKQTAVIQKKTYKFVTLFPKRKNLDSIDLPHFLWKIKEMTETSSSQLKSTSADYFSVPWWSSLICESEKWHMKLSVAFFSGPYYQEELTSSRSHVQEHLWTHEQNALWTSEAFLFFKKTNSKGRIYLIWEKGGFYFCRYFIKVSEFSPNAV